jgi:hypothetical protein
MRRNRFPVTLILALVSLFLLAIPGAAQVQAEQKHIPQQVVINGQTVNAVSVIAASGGVQHYNCLNPQQYTARDGSSQGWACYDESTGVWLLNALPPAQAQVQPVQPPAPQPQIQQPAVVYSQAAPALVYQQPPVVVYQQAPVVVYQPAPAVVYAGPAVIYQQPATVLYTESVYRVRPIVVEPAYPASVVLGTAAINAAGRIASAAIIANNHPHPHFFPPGYRYEARGWRR